jgi:hypothetical protein
MLMLHGPGTPAPHHAVEDPDVEPDDGADEADADQFEDELFGLLAHLEHLREGLEETLPARPAVAAVLVGEVMDRVTAFADEQCPLGPGPEGAEAHARQTDFQAAWLTLKDELKAPGPTPPGGGAARRCWDLLYDAVFAHFVVFTSRFPTSRSARGWVEVAATFVTELKRTLRDPDGPPQP